MIGGPVTIGIATISSFGAFDVSGNEVLVYAMATALITLVPIMGTLVVVTLQQYTRIREAWAIAQSNNLALHTQVLPKLEQLKTEGSANHAETLTAIRNGNGTGNGESGHTASGQHP